MQTIVLGDYVEKNVYLRLWYKGNIVATCSGKVRLNRTGDVFVQITNDNNEVGYVQLPKTKLCVCSGNMIDCKLDDKEK